MIKFICIESFGFFAHIVQGLHFQVPVDTRESFKAHSQNVDKDCVNATVDDPQ